MASEKGRGAGHSRGGRPRRGERDESSPAGSRGDLGDALRQLVVDTVAEKMSAGLRAKAAHLDERAARHEEAVARFAGPHDVLDLWTRRAPGARRARFTLDDIAAAAVEIADTEGFDALSMRRLAVALDAGTMTLYHYVRTKDELLALVSDTIMGELILDDEELAGGWRAAMTNLARHALATFKRHPWIFDVRDDPPIGPNAVRHFDQSLQALADLEIPLTDKLDILSAVDELVFGHALQMRNNYADIDGATTMSAYVADLAATGDYPQISKLIAEHGVDGTWDVVAGAFRDPDRFERSLRRLLDGVQHDLS
ncbi:MAG: TetR/AcrR family transcriptional regulator [Ilumatobacteraceae bacterium]